GAATGTAASALYGTSTATTGTANGVYGKTASPAGMGVIGINQASTGSAYGVYGQSSGNTGVYGTGPTVGVEGTANTYGVIGKASGTTAGSAAVSGTAAGATGTTFGVYGLDASSAGTGVQGIGIGLSKTGNLQVGQGTVGVWGDTNQIGNASGSTGGATAAVLATADNATALIALNTGTNSGSTAIPTAIISNGETSGLGYALFVGGN